VPLKEQMAGSKQTKVAVVTSFGQPALIHKENFKALKERTDHQHRHNHADQQHRLGPALTQVPSARQDQHGQDGFLPEGGFTPARPQTLDRVKKSVPDARYALAFGRNRIFVVHEG
jgi:hypothetical protein